MENGRYSWVGAIKWVRTNYGLGLRDAKKWVDRNFPDRMRQYKATEWELRSAARKNRPTNTETCYYLWVNDLRRAVQINQGEYNSLKNHGDHVAQPVANGWVMFVRS